MIRSLPFVLAGTLVLLPTGASGAPHPQATRHPAIARPPAPSRPAPRPILIRPSPRRVSALPSGWRCSNGPEFPGASGALTRGRDGNWQLTYRFGDDSIHPGTYVAAYWTPPGGLVPSGRPALSLRVRVPPEVRFGLRVRDSSGQTLQYKAIGPSLETRDGRAWQRAIVPLTFPAPGHWGGANDGYLHGSIVELGVLAEARTAAFPVHGRLSFNDLRLIASPDASYQLSGTPALVPPPAGTAALSPRLGVNIHFTADDPALDAARDAGFAFVRMDLNWARVEHDGRYDFSAYDGLWRALARRWLGVLWILDYGHPAHGGKQPQRPEDVAAFARFAAAAAAHFRAPGTRFEIWNEPNLAGFLPDPSAYPAILDAAVSAMRAVNPHVPIASAGLSQFDWRFYARLFGSGATRAVTAVGVHPYRPDGPESVVADTLALRALVRRTVGPGIPVWATEWGYPSYGYFPAARYGNGHADPARRRQAVLAARACLSVWALGYPLAVWYDLRDDGPSPTNPEHNFGLLDAAGHDKPAMRALRTLTGFARDHRQDGLVRDVPDGLHLMRLSNKRDVVFVAWNSAPDTVRTLHFSRAGLVEVKNVLGDDIQPQGAGGEGVLTLAEPDGPVYLRWRDS